MTAHKICGCASCNSNNKDWNYLIICEKCCRPVKVVYMRDLIDGVVRCSWASCLHYNEVPEHIQKIARELKRFKIVR
jgi:hypothetical protein